MKHIDLIIKVIEAQIELYNHTCEQGFEITLEDVANHFIRTRKVGKEVTNLSVCTFCGHKAVNKTDISPTGSICGNCGFTGNNLDDK